MYGKVPITYLAIYATHRSRLQSMAAAVRHRSSGEEALETLLSISDFVKSLQRQSVAATGQNGISNEHLFLKNKQ